MQRKAWKEKRIGPLVALIIVLILAIAIFSIRVKEITVTGNERYTDEQMMEILFPDETSKNTLFSYVKHRFFEHEAIPFVEDYRLVFQSPQKVEVIVYEKSVVGYVSYMSSYMYFDKDGIIVESANRKLEGIPWITGLNFGHIVLYQKLPVESQEIFDEILNLTQILSLFEIKVDKIRYNTFGEATLYLGEVEVILGNNESLNGKIAELDAQLPKLEGLSGTLFLDNYSETSTSASYVFKPKKK